MRLIKCEPKQLPQEAVKAEVYVKDDIIYIVTSGEDKSVSAIDDTWYSLGDK